MAESMGVVVLGINELNARLRAASDKAPGAVRGVLRTVSQVVVDETIPIMKSQFLGTGHAPMDGQLEASLRSSVSSSKRGASAKIIEGRPAGGQSSGMYAGVWEFGGYPGKYPYKKEGRALLPTVKKNREALVSLIDAAMKDLARMIEE